MRPWLVWGRRVSEKVAIAAMATAARQKPTTARLRLGKKAGILETTGPPGTLMAKVLRRSCLPACLLSILDEVRGLEIDTVLRDSVFSQDRAGSVPAATALLRKPH